MKVKVIDEEGLSHALFGLGLSFGKTSGLDVTDFLCVEHTKIFYNLLERSKKLAGMGGGHDKFLRQISVWLDVTAPLYWWKEADTYKIGTVTQSESTMHTLGKRAVEQSDFEGGIESEILMVLLRIQETKDFHRLNRNLPHSFLQRRILSCNYAVLATILHQREGHKLPEWKVFCDAVREGVVYPELLEVK